MITQARYPQSLRTVRAALVLKLTLISLSALVALLALGDYPDHSFLSGIKTGVLVPMGVNPSSYSAREAGIVCGGLFFAGIFTMLAFYFLKTRRGTALLACLALDLLLALTTGKPLSIFFSLGCLAFALTPSARAYLKR